MDTIVAKAKSGFQNSENSKKISVNIFIITLKITILGTVANNNVTLITAPS